MLGAKLLLKNGDNMNTNMIRCLALAVSLVVACGTVFGANPSDLLAALSEAKARSEGRARLLQSCVSTGAAIPATLQTKYEDARATFNARIEALTLEVRSKKLKEFDASAELPRLNEALNRVDQFIVLADEFLAKRKCGVLKKASWAKVGAIILTPEMLKVLIEFIQNVGSSDAERDEYIKRCEAQRILEWGKVRVILVYDWSNSKFYAAENITPQVLTRGSTSVYVNEWALPSSGGFVKEPVVVKDLPVGLSDSYKLYTGDLLKLKGLWGEF